MQRAPNKNALRFLRAKKVFVCQRTLRAYVLTYQRALRAYCSLGLKKGNIGETLLLTLKFVCFKSFTFDQQFEMQAY